MPGDGGECRCGRGSTIHGDSLWIQDGGRRDDDEARNRTCNDCAANGIDALERKLVWRNALIHDVVLRQEDHPGGDGGAHSGNHQANEARIVLEVGNHEGQTHLAPVGLREKRSDDIRHENAADGKKYLLDTFIAAAHDEQPHDDARNGNRDILAHAKELHAGGDTGELRKRGGTALDEHGNHGERGQTHAKLLTNERCEALARHRAHTRSAFLHDGEHHHHDGDNP